MRKNALRGHEILQLSKAFSMPVGAFCDPELQEKYLGKLYIQDNDTANRYSNSTTKQSKEVQL